MNILVIILCNSCTCYATARRKSRIKLSSRNWNKYFHVILIKVTSCKPKNSAHALSVLRAKNVTNCWSQKYAYGNRCNKFNERKQQLSGCVGAQSSRLQTSLNEVFASWYRENSTWRQHLLTNQALRFTGNSEAIMKQSSLSLNGIYRK